MTDPPQDSEQPGPGEPDRDEGAVSGAEPGAAPAWERNPPYAQPPGSGQPSGGEPAYGRPEYAHQPYEEPEPYAQPQYRQQPYGQAWYGQQPYGQPRYEQPEYGQQSYGQPQYGFQPYGAPPYGPYGAPGQQFTPPPAPRTSRVGLIAVITGIVLLLVAGAAVLVLSLRPPVLDAAAAERDVAAQFQQREGVAIDLDCPGDMRVRAGASYMCTGTTAEGESVRLKLTITDAKTAAYTWTEP